jgi:hypothetical protein
MAKAIAARLGCALICTFVLGQAAVAQTQKRLSWEEFSQDPARVASFREAVRVMKSRDSADKKSAEYRASWQYWGAIHGYLGNAASSGTLQDYIDQVKAAGLWQNGDEKFFQDITDMTPPDNIAKTVWDQCEHGTPNFFLWHRLYLIRFEKVLRAAAKDNTLRLPYWDYTDPTHTGLPPEFRSPTYVNAQGQSVDNPLYQARRDSSWGQPATKLDPDTTDIDAALDAPDFTSFQTEIENGIHGSVHCAMNRCPIPAMGAVPYSANDPVFWLHHTNIDRMLSCWTSGKNHKITGTAKTYTFVDTKGKLVKASTKKLIAGGKLDYAYDKERDCARDSGAAGGLAVAAASVSTSPASAPAPIGKTTAATVLGSTKNVQVRGDAVKTTLPLSTQPPASGTAPTASTAKKFATPGKRTELVLKGIEAPEHPGVIYKVFISAPGSTKREYVGSLSFFRHLHPKPHQHGQTAAVDRTLDITKAAERLGDSAELSNLEVSFEASTGRTGDAVKAQVNPKATVTIQEMSLRVR